MPTNALTSGVSARAGAILSFDDAPLRRPLHPSGLSRIALPSDQSLKPASPSGTRSGGLPISSGLH